MRTGLEKAGLEKVGLLYETNALFEFAEIGMNDPEFVPMPLHEFAEFVARDHEYDLLEILKKHYVERDSTGEIYLRPEMRGLLDYICNPTERIYFCDFKDVNYDLLDTLERRGLLQVSDDTCWQYFTRRERTSEYAIFIIHESDQDLEELEVTVWEVCK